MGELIAVITAGVFCLLFVHERWIGIRTTEKMLNRIMAKTLHEYEYFNSQHKMDLVELKKMRKRQGTESIVSIEDDDYYDKEVDEFLRGTEEDWAPGEVDGKKIKEQMSETPFTRS